MWYGALVTAPIRLAVFLAALLAVFGAAAVAGRAVDPPDRVADEPHAAEAGGHAAEAGGHAAAPSGTALPGLAVAAGGLRLQVDDTRLARGRTERFEFRILDAEGQPVRDFALEHGRRLHLIVVRRDLRYYQHLHPVEAGDGTWSVRLRLPEAGAYRVFADFRTGGRKHTLGEDLFADGAFDALGLPAPADVADAPGGYRVSLLEGKPGDLRFTVRRGGRAVSDLEPYLGSRGHLVALRAGDLAYLHTHPDEGGGPADPIAFGVRFPSAGRYRLFLQFKHAGRVRTAAFTREARP